MTPAMEYSRLPVSYANRTHWDKGSKVDWIGSLLLGEGQSEYVKIFWGSNEGNE